MPGDELATAATLSPRSIARSALTACGLTLTAAPISPKAAAASNTSAVMPKVRSACAAASPASPPPTIAILQLDGIHLSGRSPDLYANGLERFPLRWNRASRTLGLLPPPLAGEGWGGGGWHELLRVPPPQAGEGTMW